MSLDRIVIVGAGQAGGGAALALRDAGFAGTVTLIGEEGQAPYERPPLSKSAMISHDAPAPAFVATREHLAVAGIEFVSDMIVTRLDRAERTVLLADGRRLPYDRLLLATGARARPLSIEGGEHARLLRSFADALALRPRLVPGAQVAVIGGGFIGLEIAASAVARGCRVTLLEAGPRVLTRGVPAEISSLVSDKHRAAGVAIETGISLARIRPTAGGYVIERNDGAAIACDVVIAGIGAVPETSLAAECGLPLENGVKVDAALRTEDPAVFAAGDCCSFPSGLFGGRRLRLEAWRNAQDQGRHVARTMLGADDGFDAVPWFWSDQYDETLQVAGLPDAGARMVRRGDDAFWFHLAGDGTLVAASCFGGLAFSKDIRLTEMLIARRAHPDPAALASPATKLKSLLRD